MATIKSDEIAKILREQIENYQQSVAVEEVGSVISVNTPRSRKATPSSAPARSCRCRWAKRWWAAW
jgi:hypothetical protein